MTSEVKLHIKIFSFTKLLEAIIQNINMIKFQQQENGFLNKKLYDTFNDL